MRRSRLPLVVRFAPMLLAVSGCALQHAWRGAHTTGPDGTSPDVVMAGDTIAQLDVVVTNEAGDVIALAEDASDRLDTIVPRDTPPPPPDMPPPPPPPDAPLDVPPPPPDVPPPPPDAPPPPPRVAPGGSCAAADALCEVGSECVHFSGGLAICEVCGQLGQRACTVGGALTCASGMVETRAGTATGICVNLDGSNDGRPGGRCARSSDCSPTAQCDNFYGTAVCLRCGTPGLPCCCFPGGCTCNTGTCAGGATDNWTVCH